MGELRNEIKYRIDRVQALNILNGLNHIATIDKFCTDGWYKIRSLYFDTVTDKTYYDTINGLSPRDKYRLRHYGNNTSSIKFEHKITQDKARRKESIIIDNNDVNNILQSNITAIQNSYIANILGIGYRPRVIIEYDRAAYWINNLGIRVTIDKSIKASPNVLEYITGNYIPIQLVGNPIILEIKHKGVIPITIQNLMKANRIGSQTSFSKYAAARAIC